MSIQTTKSEITGTIYGIGVGPGEAELMTVKAIRTIEECDTIILPSEPIEDCYAFQIAEKMIPTIREHQLIAIPFPMIKDTEKLEEAHDAIYQQIEQMLLGGKKVAFLTIGDPSVYSTYLYIQKRVVEHGGKAEMISGIPSFCAVAARLGISLGEKEEQIHIIPGNYDVKETMQLTGTRIYMKSGRKLAELKEMLQKESTIRSLEIHCVSNCGLENEIVTDGIEGLDTEKGYLTIVIVKTKINPPPNSSRFFENRACVYYPCHKEIEHMNCMFCYCPFYLREHCPGKPEYWERDGKTIKVCTNCTFPHQPENYDIIMKMLSGKA